MSLVAPQPKPPPPVWTLIKMPPPIVDMLSIMLPPPIQAQLMDIIKEVQPFIAAYAKTFTKVAAEWLKSNGKEEVSKQLQKIVKGKQEKLKLTKFIDTFHKYAIAAVFTLVQPHLKRTAQTVYNEAMVAATTVAETRVGAQSGTNLIAAAKSVLSPEIVGKIEGMLGDVAPVLKKFFDGVLGAFSGWRKGGGDARIERAAAKLKDDLLAAGGTWPPDWSSVDVRIPVQVPIFQFLSKGILQAGLWLRDKLSKVAGEVQSQSELIDLDVESTSNALRREFSKLVQVNIISLARGKIVPLLNKAIDSIGLPNRVLVSQLRSIVFDLGEEIMRKTVHSKILAMYNSLKGQMKIPNCEEPEPEEDANEEEEEDAFGYTADEDSYKDAQPRFALTPAPKGGAGALQAQVNKIIDKDILQQMKDALGPVLPIIEAFVSGASSAAKQWYEETGKGLLEDAKVKAQEIYDGQKKKKKELTEVLETVMSAIGVPIFEFVKSGLQKAIEQLLPVLKARGGAVMAFLDKLNLPLDTLASMRASDLRRSLSQLFQEFIVDKACKFPRRHRYALSLYICLGLTLALDELCGCRQRAVPPTGRQIGFAGPGRSFGEQGAGFCIQPGRGHHQEARQ
jgi:hypothetical protein|eukprot:COSAG06_NODE_4060_length_4614_cov_818.663787_2_plen_621_part_00